jgi:hypothetical protein
VSLTLRAVSGLTTREIASAQTKWLQERINGLGRPGRPAKALTDVVMFHVNSAIKNEQTLAARARGSDIGGHLPDAWHKPFLEDSVVGTAAVAASTSQREAYSGQSAIAGQPTTVAGVTAEPAHRRHRVAHAPDLLVDETHRAAILQLVASESLSVRNFGPCPARTRYRRDSCRSD